MVRGHYAIPGGFLESVVSSCCLFKRLRFLIFFSSFFFFFFFNVFSFFLRACKVFFLQGLGHGLWFC